MAPREPSFEPTSVDSKLKHQLIFTQSDDVSSEFLMIKIESLFAGLSQLESELRASRAELRVSLAELRVSQVELRASQAELKASQAELKVSQAELKVSIDRVAASLRVMANRFSPTGFGNMQIEDELVPVRFRTKLSELLLSEIIF